MEERQKRTVRRWLWVLAGLAVALLVFAIVVGPWWLTRYPSHGLNAEQKLKARNDVRTTLVQALAGLAVAAGGYVTYRTYRQNQHDQALRHDEQNRIYNLTKSEQDRRYRLNVADQVNAVYTQAVEQLGHDEAPVRLGALYSLEQLAQDNPHRRQTVVDVFCAYLRMPYTPPATGAPTNTEGAAATEDVTPAAHQQQESGTPERRDPAQELQVRLTAQRILANHLRRPEGTTGEEAQQLPASPEEMFWPAISLDLTGASLVGFDLTRVSVLQAMFDRATFTGDATFAGATFEGEARFVAVTFTGGANFEGATFSREPQPPAAVVTYAGFARATFGGLTRFTGATFTDDADFTWAKFTGPAWFGGTTFNGAARFGGATFTDDALFAGARVLYPGPSDSRSDYRWSVDGWTVRVDSDDPTIGYLIPAEPVDPPPRSTESAE